MWAGGTRNVVACARDDSGGGVSGKSVEDETLHRIRSEQGKSTPLLTEFDEPPKGYPTCLSWSDESGDEEQDEQFEEELSVQEALLADATVGAKTESDQVSANEMGCCLLWLNCIWNLLCAVASVGAVLVAGAGLGLVIVAETV